MLDKTPDEMERIDNGLIVIGEVFDKTLSEATLDIYHKVLRPYTVAQIENALFKWMNSTGDPKYRFFPVPSQIIELIEMEDGPSIEVRSLQQWRLVMDSIRRYGANHPPKFTDPITQHLISTQFRWSYLCGMPEAKEPWEQKRWCEAFELSKDMYEFVKEIDATEEVRELLEPIGTKIEPETTAEKHREVPAGEISSYLDKKKEAFEERIKKQELRTPLERQKELKEQAAELIKQEGEDDEGKAENSESG